MNENKSWITRIAKLQNWTQQQINVFLETATDTSDNNEIWVNALNKLYSTESVKLKLVKNAEGFTSNDALFEVQTKKFGTITTYANVPESACFWAITSNIAEHFASIQEIVDKINTFSVLSLDFYCGRPLIKEFSNIQLDNNSSSAVYLRHIENELIETNNLLSNKDYCNLLSEY